MNCVLSFIETMVKYVLKGMIQ